jgi:uncharacterized membrane protein
VRFAIDREMNHNAEWAKKGLVRKQHRAGLTFFIRVCLFFQGTHEGFAVAYFLVSRQESMTS